MKPLKSLQTIAADWHQNEGALYNYAITGIATPGLPAEIRNCLPSARPKEVADLLRLYVATAPALTPRDIINGREFWHRIERNTDGTPLRCRPNGKPKFWKTRPHDFKLPVKYGLKNCFYLTPANISDWCLAL